MLLSLKEVTISCSWSRAKSPAAAREGTATIGPRRASSGGVTAGQPIEAKPSMQRRVSMRTRFSIASVPVSRMIFNPACGIAVGDWRRARLETPRAQRRAVGRDVHGRDVLLREPAGIMRHELADELRAH